MPWELDGNNIGGNQFLGTRQNDPLRIRTRSNENNADAMIITPAPNANNTGNVGIGTRGNPENAEGWSRVVDVLGGQTTKLSVRTGAIDARVLAHEGGWAGAPAGMIVGTRSAHPLSFYTNNANRVTIAQDGTVAIGTQAAGAPFPGELFLGGIRTSLRGFDGAGFHWIRSNGNEGDMWMAFVNANAVDPFVKRMVAAVDWYGPLFQEWSDARTKTNIRQVGGPLDKLERIRGVAFEWAESPQALGCTPGRPSIGVIAQEVEAVFPELVSVYDDQGYKAVNYSGLTSVLIEAAKELKAENEALRSRIEALEQAA